MKNKLKFIAVVMALCITSELCLAQQLNMAEYFFDQDPGIGNGIMLNGLNPITGIAYDSIQFNTSIQVPTNMAPGVHRLYVRIADGNRWSQYEAAKFTVKPPNGNTLARMEYFIDQDPGVGNGVTLAAGISADSALFNGHIPTNNLATGYHHVSVRMQDVQGKWSTYQTRKFYVNQSNNNVTVDRVEYFYDQDPGIGNAQGFVVTGNMDSSSFTGNISTAGLTMGRHQLYTRCRTNNGFWSQYEKRQIQVIGNLITQAEYFVDHDPGAGNATPISLSPSGLEAEYGSMVSTIGLTAGRHTLCFRAKTTNGKWGIFETRKIQVYDNPLIGEYYFDTDPGVGNATAISLNNTSPGQAEFNGNLPTTYNLFHGSHRLFVRSYSASGKWGHSDSAAFYINCSNPVVGQVAQTPGIGSCGDEGVLLSLQNSSLNEGTQWNWYGGSCGGNLLGSGSTMFVTPDDTTSYYVRGEGGCTNVFTCTNIPVNFNPTSHLKLKLFLEGYYTSAGSMTTTLFNEGQPTCDNITDTVMVELHNPNDYSLVSSKKAILHTDGTSRCNFMPLTGSYYVAIKHRNSVETWSGNSMHLGNEMAVYDFSNSSSKAYADNMKEVESGVWAFFSGDVNGDGAIDAFDYLELAPEVYNGESGYRKTDLNGDGSVDAFDYLILAPNIFDGIGSMVP